MNKNDVRSNSHRFSITGVVALVVVLTLTGLGQTQGQWISNGNNINNTNSGNVGVGTATPSTTLDVNGTIAQRPADAPNVVNYFRTNAANKFSTTNLNPGLLVFGPAAHVYGMDLGWNPGISRFRTRIFSPTAADISFATHAEQTVPTSQGSFVDRMVIRGDTGNVGIGTMNPLAILDVRNSDGLSYAAFGFGTNKETFLRAGNATNGTMHIGDLNTSKTLLQENGGNVGIGTATPNTSYKLDVTGRVNASAGLCIAGDCKTAWSQVGGSGGGTITGVAAGTGLSGGGTTGSVSLTNTDRGSSQFIFKNIADASGVIRFPASSNNDSLRFAGTGGTAITFDAATKKVTIDATGSTGSAANIAAGQFGLNTGGGNYTFPGNVTVNGTINAKYQDVAEWVRSSQALSAGTVVIIDSTKSNQVIASTKSYDSRVAGVVSPLPGIALGEGGEGRLLIATTGRVKVKVDATNGSIEIGDLLVTGDKEGVAMKSVAIDIGGVRIHRPGTLIGKALEPLARGRSEILVLLSLQ